MGAAVVGVPNAHDGWPGRLTIATSTGNEEVALHVSGISSHSRGTYESRFQNPAAEDRPPVSSFNDAALPVLLGLDDVDNPTVFVAFDGRSRVGNANRFSLLFNNRILAEARVFGWAEYESSNGEKVYAFVPELFPAFVEQILGGEMLPPRAIHEAAVAAGLLGEEVDLDETINAARRATKAVNILVRKAGAGKRIRAAYGDRCAMCGIGSNLLVGAHIFPVEAPGSTDEIWNGLSLCQNHHSAFDQHLIWIDPITRTIRLHQHLHAEALTNPGARHFVQSTFGTLAAANGAAAARQAMFEQRYAYYEGKYDWAG